MYILYPLLDRLNTGYVHTSIRTSLSIYNLSLTNEQACEIKYLICIRLAVSVCLQILGVYLQKKRRDNLVCIRTYIICVYVHIGTILGALYIFMYRFYPPSIYLFLSSFSMCADSCMYFLDNAPRICDPQYVPTETDILRAR